MHIFNFSYFPPRASSRDLVSAVASDFVFTLMPDVDPMVGFTYTPVGCNMLMYKFIEPGVVAAIGYLFYQWNQFQFQRQQKRQQKRQQEQQQQQQQVSPTIALVATTTMAIYNQPEVDSFLGFDFERFEMQDEQQQHSLYRQLLADMKEMKQQLRQQQQHFAQQEVTHKSELQRLQGGKDTKNEKYQGELQQLKQRLNETQKFIDEKDKELEQAEARARMDKRGADPLWERSERGDEDWKTETQTTRQTHALQDHTTAHIFSYATVVFETVVAVIDQWIDDRKLHGGIIADRNCVEGHIVADWGVRVRQRFADRDAEQSSNYLIFANKVTKRFQFPVSDSSPERDAGVIMDLRSQNHSNDDDDFGDIGDGSGTGPRAPDRRRGRDSNFEDRAKEFQSVNFRNMTISIFSGKKLSSNPYINFNNQIRRFIFAMGEDGVELVNALNEVEQPGNQTYIAEDLSKLAKDVPKAHEYDRAVKVVFVNLIIGIPQGLEHGTEGSFDVWRNLFNRYIPLADGMQNIFIRQLMGLKQVSENETDSLFDEIDRIREQYIQIGSKQGPMNDKRVRAAMLQHLQDKVVQTLAVELKRVESVEDIYSMINIYTYNYKIGLPRGQTSPMLYLTENQAEEDGGTTVNNNNAISSGGQIFNTDVDSNQGDKDTNPAANNGDNRNGTSQELFATSKGKAQAKHVGIAERRAISSASVPMEKPAIR